VIGKGIEPHPTDENETWSCPKRSTFFLTTLRLMERPLSRHLSCRE